jgi:rhodanese-related sulfurtransferase
MKEVSVQELKNKIDNNEDFQLIDVRESFEYEVSNLNGLNIPLSGILIEADKIAKDKPVIVQCRSGKRSAQAIMLLEQQGFDNLANLKGASFLRSTRDHTVTQNDSINDKRSLRVAHGWNIRQYAAF